MTTAQSLLTPIVASIRKAQAGLCRTETIFTADKPYGSNNWLFFIKPEITQPLPAIKLEAIVELILEQLQQYGLTIHEVKLLSADYLKDHGLIKQHYGVIDTVATVGAEALSEVARERFKELFGVEAGEVKTLGGFQMLEQYPIFNAHSLDCLWQNQENLKLAGGAYAEKVRIDQETIYLLNAFQPRQLEHFTEKGRCIVVMNISGNLSWKESRRNFIGATKPQAAEVGSLRKLLLERKDEFGLPEVSQSYNGVHLSAGPVESLVESLRFESDHDGGSLLDPSALPFGRQCVEAFGCVPDALLHNALIQVDGHFKSIFDLTEELDAAEAIGVLKTILRS
jgi:nucleoside diphosphate kinase